MPDSTFAEAADSTAARRPHPFEAMTFGSPVSGLITADWCALVGCGRLAEHPVHGAFDPAWVAELVRRYAAAAAEAFSVQMLGPRPWPPLPAGTTTPGGRERVELWWVDVAEPPPGLPVCWTQFWGPPTSTPPVWGAALRGGKS